MLIANQENSILNIYIPNIENSEFFNDYLLMWDNLEVKDMNFEITQSKTLNLIPLCTYLWYTGQVTGFCLAFVSLPRKQGYYNSYL